MLIRGIAIGNMRKERQSVGSFDDVGTGGGALA